MSYLKFFCYLNFFNFILYNTFTFLQAKIKNLTPDQAAAQAIQLFSQEARLCDRAPSKVARTHDGQSSTDKDVNSSSSADNLQSSSKTNVEDNEMPGNYS